MAESIKWTKLGLKAIQPPAKGRVVYHDPECRNLILTVTEKGTKTFSRYGRVHGKPERIRIGTFPEWSIENARLKCIALSGDIARGINPADVIRANRKADTLADAWTWYFENHAKPHKRSWRKDLARWNNHLKRHGHIRLNAITRDMVTAWHQEIGAKAPQQANIVLTMLQTIMRHAVQNGLIPSSPLAGMRRFAAKPKERYLTADEMPAFFDAMDILKPHQVAFILLCLMTGARRSNVCAMRWDELDFNNQVWIVPAEKSKNKRTLHIPLSAEAIDVIKSRHNDSAWVFPSSHSTTGHMTEVKVFWKKLLNAANIKHIRVHDLRHTVATWQANRGVSMQIIGKSLAQSNLKSTERYSHIAQDPVRESLERTFADIKQASEKKS